MNKIIFLTITVFTLTIKWSFGQDLGQKNADPKRNTIFFEAGGNSFFYSINYDRLLKIKEKWRLAGRIGVMYVNTFTNERRSMIGIPMEFSYLRGHSNRFFELGIGVSGIYDHYYTQSNLNTSSEVKDFVLLSVLRLGYRYQKHEGGLFYKIGLTPLAGAIIDFNKDKTTRYKFDKLEKFAFPWVSASIGWTIKK
jgi:hypothetical protein